MTVTVDAALLRAGEASVKAGHAASLSAWVNAALAEHADRERRLAARAAAIAAYEATQGVITEQEMTEQRRLDRARARIIAPAARPAKAAPRRRRAA